MLSLSPADILHIYNCTPCSSPHNSTSVQTLIFTGCLVSEWWISSRCFVRIWTCCKSHLVAIQWLHCSAEKGTLPNRNAEEVPLVGHYHKDSQPQGSLGRAYVCPHWIMEYFFFFCWIRIGWLSSLMFNLGFTHAQYTAVHLLCFSFFVLL